jgi:hypothetical protein
MFDTSCLAPEPSLLLAEVFKMLLFPVSAPAMMQADSFIGVRTTPNARFFEIGIRITLQVFLMKTSLHCNTMGIFIYRRPHNASDIFLFTGVPTTPLVLNPRTFLSLLLPSDLPILAPLPQTNPPPWNHSASSSSPPFASASFSESQPSSASQPSSPCSAPNHPPLNHPPLNHPPSQSSPL